MHSLKHQLPLAGVDVQVKLLDYGSDEYEQKEYKTLCGEQDIDYHFVLRSGLWNKSKC